ncbi:hypothetical protein BLNAU_13478 [Blattamonas nauphoetae]|uniref:Secreted protein n=1 Tax=Blattamonas nauphoetae TaxID=2049346 RepID=A0ABQ9XL78_9EUKA|nr:hypothetical protein BLNAU_13478 [Blattamonas nauphoetae]
MVPFARTVWILSYPSPSMVATHSFATTLSLSHWSFLEGNTSIDALSQFVGVCVSVIVLSNDSISIAPHSPSSYCAHQLSGIRVNLKMTTTISGNCLLFRLRIVCGSQAAQNDAAERLLFG